MTFARWQRSRINERSLLTAHHHKPMENAVCMILKFQIPAEKGNQAIKDGSMGKSMEPIVTALKPEAAHFMPMDGRRSGMLFFQLTEEF